MNEHHERKYPGAPLFRDPIYDGAADPTIIWNSEEESWWILYTNRRATAPTIGHTWIHGTDIGVAASKDGGQTWVYRGTLAGLEFEPGRNTFWAPEVLRHGDTYHMYLSYVQGVPSTWNHDRRIIHYTSSDLWKWHLESVLDLSSPKVIDACVCWIPDGRWRMWYKDEAHGSHTYAADSDDLYHWSVTGPAITDAPHEGPNVFSWSGAYWLVADFWKGLSVYRSDDASHWVRQENILDSPGARPDDNGVGHHADVLVAGTNAYAFYFTHPGEGSSSAAGQTGDGMVRRSSLQVARLELEQGRVVCNRDKPFELVLGNGDRAPESTAE